MIDGFAALKVYDDNHDGVIDSEDIVFSELRLWADTDRSGNALGSERQMMELSTLADAGIVAISVMPDKNYSEVDGDGNRIQYKAIVSFDRPEDNGAVRKGVIFDLIFSTGH